MYWNLPIIGKRECSDSNFIHYLLARSRDLDRGCSALNRGTLSFLAYAVVGPFRRLPYAAVVGERAGLLTICISPLCFIQVPSCRKRTPAHLLSPLGDGIRGGLLIDILVEMMIDDI